MTRSCKQTYNYCEDARRRGLILPSLLSSVTGKREDITNKMDYESNNMTPRDRIGNELRRILEQESGTNCGSHGIKRAGNGRRKVPEKEEKTNCGCRTTMPEREERSHCGCRTTMPEREERSRCGCRTTIPEREKSSRGNCRNDTSDSTCVPCSGAGSDICRENLSSYSGSCSENGGNQRFASHALSGLPLAMVYSPCQEWDRIYDDEEGFERGTIFSDIDFPFYPTPCNKSCSCRERSGI